MVEIKIIHKHSRSKESDDKRRVTLASRARQRIDQETESEREGYIG